MSITLDQRTNGTGFAKPGELIEITGAHELEASDRAILNVLYQAAHDSGLLADGNARWEVPMSALRISQHRGKGRIADSLDRLMRVVVTVPRPDARTGEPRAIKTHLFDFFDLSADESAFTATVRFGLPRDLQPIIARSNRWGRIKAETVCAMTSKYAIALYELVQLRAGLDRCVETFPIGRFRELLGVPPGAYERGANFTTKVTEPAALEVNGLSDLGVEISLVRRSKFAPIEAVTVAWWRKDGDAYREAVAERNRSKLGRAARLRGTAEAVRPPPLPALPPPKPPASRAAQNANHDAPRTGRKARRSTASAVRTVPMLPDPPPSRAAAILAELDARHAPDIEYRAAFSTDSKRRNRPGETWRGRLVARVARESAASTASAARPLPEPPAAA
jgi:Initiator Replication protein